MAALLLETSALVKRWVTERGSAWVRAQTGPAEGEPRFVARFVGPEIAGAVTRAHRSGRITTAARATALAEIQADMAGRFAVIEMTKAVLDRAMVLARDHGLKGADAVHLAAACELQATGPFVVGRALTFVSADHELLAAAPRCGLAIDNPLAHGSPGE